ncbi:metallophosphoesterase [Nocardia otitidiscaviarum]|uniref:Metallophosphoesterase n=2 Tax=Nocardia otitidiscaviarum TaxID=1823 RepID=A0A378YRR9_9NOCA|nr:metallophosphoesterase [Nocardia otitidiscaviarum]MBF6132616.1 metallophosphoesterase [Nocardia otitidiscaviarum]MBF6183476.1 metallophosphoesterase [Nocardia otitidiscaviarum]MBF6240704.1 metallophosphoesterase [Nocardia otitidiscaviarum]MBF6488717.1 metallophosphoesterase [Nocardia otitidiscaviarum]MCP9623980.1 metallophosphoesterase [Nocardia otitidiscaviarum]
MNPKLMAVSDIHVGHQGNKPVVERIRPDSPEDWLILAGDVGEKTDDIRWALETLRGRFAKVIWVPGNHELWTTAKDPVQIHGAPRYDYLVSLCRDLDVITPEDPFPVWTGAGAEEYGGAVTLAPLFVLYDYSWMPDGALTKAQGLSIARDRNVVATDEFLLSPQPYATRDAWCHARVQYTQRRLDALAPDTPLVLINHFPLLRDPTKMLFYPEFALWCGTELTEDWHIRYNVVCSVYGHLHIPRTTFHEGVRHEEVSLGYPREWQRRGLPDQLLRQILPTPQYGPDDLNAWGGHFKITPEMEKMAAQMRAQADKRRGLA